MADKKLVRIEGGQRERVKTGVIIPIRREIHRNKHNLLVATSLT